MRERFENLYRAVYKLRELFASDSKYYDPDGKQRRLETLVVIRDTIEKEAKRG